MKEDITKKRSFIKTLWEKSAGTIVALGIVLCIVLDCLMVGLELHFNIITADEIIFTFIFTFILNVMLICLFISLAALLVDVGQALWMLLRSLPREIRKLKAIYRYCFIPLTEDEIRKYSFTSVKDYFTYIKVQLRYGLSDKDKEFIDIDVEDFRKMLVTSAAVFGEKEVFSLEPFDYELFVPSHFEFLSVDLDDIVIFLYKYNEYLEQGNVYVGSEKVEVKSNGRVKLSYEERSTKRHSITLSYILHARICQSGIF